MMRCILFYLLFPITVLANNPTYDWEKNRSRFKLTQEEELLPELILKDHIEYNYVFEDNQFVKYAVFHRIVRVNTIEAIQRHNKIKISLDRTIGLVELKARSINLKNKVTDFDKSNLKEVKEEDDNYGYKIFAMEGVEIGSEIEYFFVRKMAPTLYGQVYLQIDAPIKTASFSLRCPKHLEFDFKSYNGLSAIEKGQTDEQNTYHLTMHNIPAIKKEDYSYLVSLKQRVEFKLAYNTAKSKARLYTWEEAGKEFYSGIFNASKDELKSLEKFVNELRDNDQLPLQDRIRKVERKIKSSFQVESSKGDESLRNLGSVTKHRIASRFGLTRLFLYVFDALKIPTQIVMTCNREYAQFDEAFDTWNYLDDYFIYFPSTNGFIAPYNLSLSYPLIDAEFAGQKGLFIEPIEIGSLKSGLASIQMIPASSYHHNTDDLDIEVNFNSDFTGNEVKLKRQFKGYNAMYIAPYYHLMTEQQKLAMVDEIVKQTAPDLVVKKWTAQPKFDGEVDQFNLDVNFTSSHFVERAGPRILFKVGLLIGPQVEMYRDDKRTHAIENGYNRGYDRTIQVTIPNGYKVKNIDDLKFNVYYNDGEAIPYLFETAYTQEGQLLTITIKEYYKQIHAPVERYEDYRKVINAAADFNKVTLVLEKQ